MKVLKNLNFNTVSKELLNSIPKLEKGEVRTFEMLTAQDFFYTQDGTSHTKEIVYGRTQIPTKDRIKDPFTGEYVDIGVVERVEGENVITSFFMPGMGEGQFFLGRFSLTGGRLADEELFEYAWISNYNDSNPYRDKSIEPLFRYVDPAASAKQRTKKLDILRDALNLAGDLTLGEAREIADALNMSYTDETVKDMIYDYANEDPKGFTDLYGKPATKIKSDIKRALNAGVITYDPSTKKLCWEGGKGTIATIDDSGNYLESIADWIATAKNGDNTIQGIRKKLKALYKTPEPVEE